eukprot:CAMPEP_0177617050 /NCGR_PEP_ID=MMETSP0419_2-20121207/24607_1 /TAXON_ID=582737 /ORGANISM="Tetraselmis sp., Strain GSL018" /LENGTH=473 /DNA_ID=CAMNT_0019115399 /DNA_START=105 /DNA_END=1525 /DNA_ORIENTATION=+
MLTLLVVAVLIQNCCLQVEALSCDRWKSYGADKIPRCDLTSAERWSISGHVTFSGLSSVVELRRLLEYFRPDGKLTPYKQVRTKYQTLIHPKNSGEFLGNHSLLQSGNCPDTWSSSCCVGQPLQWKVFAVFGAQEEAADFHSYVTNTLTSKFRQVFQLCVSTELGTSRTACAAQQVHVKVRSCAPESAYLRAALLEGLPYFGPKNTVTLWRYLQQRYLSLTRPVNSYEFYDRMQKLNGGFGSESCPAIFDDVSGAYRPQGSIAAECCCRDPVDWDIEAEFSDERDAKSFLSYMKTTVPRVLTSRGGTCSKAIAGGAEPIKSAYQVAVVLEMCSSAPLDSLAAQLREISTVQPFKLLSYIHHAFPSLRSPMTPSELVSEHSLVELGEGRCLDPAGGCCCDRAVAWHLLGRFSGRQHAEDFLDHVVLALRRRIAIQLDTCTAVTSAGLHDLSCVPEMEAMGSPQERGTVRDVLNT